MRIKWYKQLSLFLVMAMLVSMLPVYAAAADGEGEINPVNAIVHYVNYSDTTKISSMATYLKNGKIYTQDEQTYLRVDVQQVYDVEFLLEGKEGTQVGDAFTAQTIGYGGKPSEATFITYDYEVSDVTEVLEGSVTYFVPAYFEEPQTHEVYVVINNDIDAVKAELAAAIAEADEIVTKSTELETALEAAVAANNYITKKADMEDALADLKAVLLTLPVSAIVHYVNYKDPTKLSSMASYLKNGKLYTEGETTYLRVDVKQESDVKFLLEEKEGTKVGEYEELTVGRNGTESLVTYFTFDYEVSDVTKLLVGSVTYFVPAYFEEPQTHELYVVINNDIDAVKAELAAAIAEADEIVTKSTELETALEAAIAANNYITKKADMEDALADLKAVLLTIPVSAIVHYVNYKDPTKLSSMASYLKNGKLYTEGETTYLRVDVKQESDVKFLLEEKEGTKVGEYEELTVGRNGTESLVTYFTFEYEVSDVTKLLVGSVTYFVPAYFEEPQTHELYVVINNDIDAVKAQLADAIETAGKVSSPKEELKTALTAAKAANNYITKKADIQAALTALTTALANQGNSGGTTPPGSTPVINEATGLEVGKYYVPVTILQANGNEVSYMNQYVLDDARLEVTKNSLTVYLLLGGASMIQNFTVNGSKASVSDDYSADDVKRFRFSASSLATTLKGSVHVIVNEPPVVYDTTHDIQISFGDAYQVDKWENEGYSKGGSVTPVETEDKEKEEENKQEETNNGSTNPTNPTKPTVVFSDVANHWAKQAIDRAISLGIVNGYSDGTFKPNSTVNRAEFTAIIARAMKLEAKATEVTFADAKNIQSWAQPYIQQALQAGIINGFSDNTFRPTANVNRADMTVMIVRALNLPLVDASELDFKDADQIPAYAKAYVATAVKYGLITGFADHTFGASKEATRAEAITMALRAVDQAAKK